MKNLVIEDESEMRGLIRIFFWMKTTSRKNDFNFINSQKTYLLPSIRKVGFCMLSEKDYK